MATRLYGKTSRLSSVFYVSQVPREISNKIMFKFNHLLSPLEFLNNIDMKRKQTAVTNIFILYLTFRMLQHTPGGGGGGTLGISGWGCAAGTLEPLAYTRASFSWLLLPYTRVDAPNHSYPRVVVFQKLRSLAQSKAKPKQNLIPQLLLS